MGDATAPTLLDDVSLCFLNWSVSGSLGDASLPAVSSSCFLNCSMKAIGFTVFQ